MREPNTVMEVSDSDVRPMVNDNNGVAEDVKGLNKGVHNVSLTIL